MKLSLEKWHASEVGGKVLSASPTTKTFSRKGVEKPAKRATEGGKANDSSSDPVEQEYLRSMNLTEMETTCLALSIETGQTHTEYDIDGSRYEYVNN